MGEQASPFLSGIGVFHLAKVLWDSFAHWSPFPPWLERVIVRGRGTNTLSRDS